MKTEPTPIPTRVAISKEGDVLITQGADHPVLFVAHHLLELFTRSPHEAPVLEIRGIGATTILACLAANAYFRVISRKSLAIQLTLPNGLRVLFSDDEDAQNHATWSGKNGSDIVVSSTNVSLTSARALSQLHLQPTSQVASSVQASRSNADGEKTKIIVRAMEQRNASTRRT